MPRSLHLATNALLATQVEVAYKLLRPSLCTIHHTNGVPLFTVTRPRMELAKRCLTDAKILIDSPCARLSIPFHRICITASNQISSKNLIASDDYFCAGFIPDKRCCASG